jgi:archaeal type IV pilus assembly protein PilA
MRNQKDMAVSPVVAVMLMLVVTIIIAAVVSGFAGSLVSGSNQKTPTLSMDAKIVNTGYWSSSFFKAQVTGVDGGVKTNDLKLVTTWTKRYYNGSTLDGGATVIPRQTNFKVNYQPADFTTQDTWYAVCPQGYGPGVGLNGTEDASYYPFEGTSGTSMSDVWSGTLTNVSWFGNYNLKAGTTMFARPFGGKLSGQADGSVSYTVGYGIPSTTGTTGGQKYYYCYGTDASGAILSTYPDSIDQMQAVLGNNWNELRAGDKVNMKLIYTPSGKTIWQKDISVEG